LSLEILITPLTGIVSKSFVFTSAKNTTPFCLAVLIVVLKFSNHANINREFNIIWETSNGKFCVKYDGTLVEPCYRINGALKL
jgi:hypothetical protein